MKIIIAGNRDAVGYEVFDLVRRGMEDFFPACTEVVSGGATGVDGAGEAWANENGIPIKQFPVTKEEWRTHGKRAGPMRNRKMAEYADGLLAVWDGKSRGTANMINEARRRGLIVRIVTL